MIVIGNIRDRRNELLARRDEAVAALRSLGAREDTPLLRAVDRCADDIFALVAEVERLASQQADTDLRKALIGILRADGYQVTEPGPPVPSAPAKKRASVVVTAGERTNVMLVLDSGRCIAGGFTDSADTWVPLAMQQIAEEFGCDVAVRHDTQAHVPVIQSDSAPFSNRVPVEPESPPKQPELFSDVDPNRPYRGAYAVVCGDSPHAGRSVMLHEQRGNSWTAELLSRHVQITKTIPMNASTLILDGFPDPDAPKDVTRAAEPKPDATQEKPGRAPEAAKPVAEWQPSEKDIADMATRAGRTPGEISRLLAKFKEDEAKSTPQPRWRPAFVSWAKSDAATKFLAS